jgi:CubicO group peptidase (beta-lactamase class C family)
MGRVTFRNPRRQMTPNTPVCLFSTSKAVTATLVHILHERGALDINRRVAEYIPEFGKNGKHDITVADVLSHRAGFSGFTRKGMSGEIFEFDHVVRVLCEQRAELHTKGAVAYHAVTGGYILAEVVKRATGHDLRHALYELVRGPLGFEWFDYGAPGKDISQIAQNYVTGWPNIFRSSSSSNTRSVVRLKRSWVCHATSASTAQLCLRQIWWLPRPKLRSSFRCY